MGKSVVELCNTALGRLGISQIIASLDEQSNEARTCRVFYENTRDRVLTDMPWNFAKRTADLQDIGSPPPGWTYRFRYPNDCLKVRSIISTELTGYPTQYLYPGDINYTNDPQIPYEVIEDEASGGLAIVCNLSPVSLVYTAQITNLMLFSQLAFDTLGWALASDIAAPLSAAPNMAQSAANAYTSAMLRAGASMLNESRPNADPTSELILARQ